MPFEGWGGGGGVKGPRADNMPRAPRNVNPALIELRGGLMFHDVIAKALFAATFDILYKCSKHAGKQQNVL